MDQNADVVTESLAEGENTSKPHLNGWHSQSDEQTESREELVQAHQALSTAYQSLKQRLLRSEAEKQGLERELRSITHQNSMETATSPKHLVNGPTSNGDLTNAHLLRTVRSEHSMAAQRHGSWGYVNDGLPTTGNIGSYAQKCQLMEIQLAKVEEERAQAQTELKQVRTRLTELTLTQDQHRRHANDLHLAQSTIKSLELKVTEAETEKRELRTRVDELLREQEKVFRERDEVVRDQEKLVRERDEVVRTLQQRCSGLEKQLAQKSTLQRTGSGAGAVPKHLSKDDDVETQTQVQAVTVMALQAVEEQKRVKALVVAQQDVIRTLQAKLDVATSQGSDVRQRKPSTQHPTDRPSANATTTLICQAQDDTTHGDAFGDYYHHKSPPGATMVTGGNGGRNSPKNPHHHGLTGSQMIGGGSGRNSPKNHPHPHGLTPPGGTTPKHHTPLHTPGHTPVHTPKQPSSSVNTPTQSNNGGASTNFAFDPIESHVANTGNERFPTGNENSPTGSDSNNGLPVSKPHHGGHIHLKRTDYLENNAFGVALDMNEHEVRSPPMSPPGDHAGFPIDEEEQTMTRIPSEDININLEPVHTRSAESSRFLNDPPPSPCHRRNVSRGESPSYGGGNSSPRRGSPRDYPGRTGNPHHHHMPTEAVESSTYSQNRDERFRRGSPLNDDVIAGGGSNPQLPAHRTSRPSDSSAPFGTGVHGTSQPYYVMPPPVHMGTPTDTDQYLLVQPTANTETGSPAVRPKQTNLLAHQGGDRRMDSSNKTTTHGGNPLRRGATMPTYTPEMRSKPDVNKSQTLPRQQTNRNTWSPGQTTDMTSQYITAPPETTNMYQNIASQQRMTTVYDGPAMGGMRTNLEGDIGGRRDSTSVKPPPVENEEWVSGGGGTTNHTYPHHHLVGGGGGLGIREGGMGGGSAFAMGRQDSEVNQCVICNMPFGPGTTIEDKERHVNECLTKPQKSKPATFECPVCKNIFPADFGQRKFELHVHGHFGDLPAERYEIIDANSFTT